MENLPAEDSRRVKRTWLWGAVLVGMYVTNELIVWNPGSRAFFAFGYVTLRGWLLPLLSFGFAVSVLVQAGKARSWFARAAVLSAGTIPTAIVSLCWVVQWPLLGTHT